MSNKTKGRGIVVPLPPPHMRAAWLARIRAAQHVVPDQEPPAHGSANHDRQADRPAPAPRIR
jgi:hypothetical protein